MDSNRIFTLSVWGDLTEEIFRHKNATNKRAWRGTFKVMTWLHSATNISGKIKLVLKYVDDRGKHTLEIDKCRPENSSHVLLSNSLPISFSGEILEASLVAIIDVRPQTSISVLERGFEAGLKKEEHTERARPAKAV